jgi:hypothetical protein
MDAPLAVPGAPVAPSEQISVYEKSALFNEERSVHIHVVRMGEGFYVWAGDQRGRMDNLAVAIQTRFDQMPSARELLDVGKDDGPGRGMATRLAKRFKAPVFLSVNFPTLEDELALFVERELLALISEAASAGKAAS